MLSNVFPNLTGPISLKNPIATQAFSVCLLKREQHYKEVKIQAPRGQYITDQ